MLQSRDPVSIIGGVVVIPTTRVTIVIVITIVVLLGRLIWTMRGD